MIPSHFDHHCIVSPGIRLSFGAESIDDGFGLIIGDSGTVGRVVDVVDGGAGGINDLDDVSGKVDSVGGALGEA